MKPTSSGSPEPTQAAAPLHSIAKCPICEGGLCGIRVCTGDDPTVPIEPRGFVLCDECEALWYEPDVRSEHGYVDPESPRCPVCNSGLWGGSRWATRQEIETIGWADAIDASLDLDST